MTIFIFNFHWMISLLLLSSHKTVHCIHRYQPTHTHTHTQTHSHISCMWLIYRLTICISPSGYQISSFPSLWLEQTSLWAFRTFQGFPGGVSAKEPTFQYGRVCHLILENERDQKKTITGLPGSPVAKTQVSNVGGLGWIPGKATRSNK